MARQPTRSRHRPHLHDPGLLNPIPPWLRRGGVLRPPALHLPGKHLLPLRHHHAGPTFPPPQLHHHLHFPLPPFPPLPLQPNSGQPPNLLLHPPRTRPALELRPHLPRRHPARRREPHHLLRFRPNHRRRHLQIVEH
ncbi:OLC1v1032386C1 [Oldenlandia corymbosa var. corymbosa]|uniref:OLC1v1032386C1 n=1 Tax=Oldenlandia corymbosa var. corymbosa TaxID=529605 RepID=A0AAV1CKW6_OLDCO|nr:OLC1v1032386C1 [Oldenlandia corymbosa var. corymbosa]